jgi:hypothetical protein
MTFWIIVGAVLATLLGLAWWVDHRAKRRNRGSIDPQMRSGESGVNHVIGKDYDAFSPRHATDRDGHNGLGQF